MIKCIGCGKEFNDIFSFEKHLLEYHFLTYQEYCELELMRDKNNDFYCFKCNKCRSPMTFLMRDEYYLPCWECAMERKAEKLEAINSVQRDLKEYYDKILGDRYYQLYIIDSIYFRSTLPHNYSEFKEVLGNMNLPSRNDIWFIDWKLGYPKTINLQNINGLKIINLSDYYKVESSKNSLRINNYEVILPEILPYDVRHYSRYNLINQTSDRRTKRLKMTSSNNCVKFYNNLKSPFKSIFQIVKYDTKEKIELEDLTYQDYVIIKLALLRNKTFVRLIYDIIFEVLKYAGTFRDGVFLKNTIITNPEKSKKFNLSWLPEEDYNRDNINISIL